MSAMVRCPACDSFVKPASIEAGTCPFCPSATAVRRRDAIPGVVLAAAIAGAGCSGGSGGSAREVPAPVYGGAPEVMEVKDAGASEPGEPPREAEPAADAMQRPDVAPVYGIAPETIEPK